MKIYTKTGDKGLTSLIGGTRVQKNDLRIEAYGTLDELNSYLGLLRSESIEGQLKESILTIQRFLFSIGSFLATDVLKATPTLTIIQLQEQTNYLEEQIDVMEHNLPQLSNFVIPGGGKGAAVCHVCRTVCRRLERRLLDISKDTDVEFELLKYINRLSDYLFVLARRIAFTNNEEVFL